jgi:hypothetical protein
MRLATGKSCCAMAENYAYLKREFLNPVDTAKVSFIYAQVESSINGSDPSINNVILIADCRRVITLDFFVGDAEFRRRSRDKINLDKEATLIENFKEETDNEEKANDKE